MTAKRQCAPIKLRIDAGVNNVQLTPWTQYSNGPPGTEPYKLYAYLSQQLPAHSKVADCGTHMGASASALASNPQVSVLSVDVQNKLGAQQYHLPANVQFLLRDCLEVVPQIVDLGCLLILLDVDPHDGAQEALFFVDLLNLNYKGLLVLDDINLNTQMKRFWAALGSPVKPLDVTKYGHHSGTGIVVFDPSVIDVEVE